MHAKATSRKCSQWSIAQALQYVVDEALEQALSIRIRYVGAAKGAIEDYFESSYELEEALVKKNKQEILEAVNATRLPAGASSFVRQQSPLGLGHAIWCARDIIGNEPFAVLLPDVLVKSNPSCLAQMAKAFDTAGGNIIAVDPVPEERVSSYGVIAPKSRDGRLIEMTGMVEKPERAEAPSNLAITGRYILQPEIFGLLENQETGAGGEIQLTDAMARLMEMQKFYAYEFEGSPYDCGSKAGYFEAVLAYALDHPDTADAAKALVKAAAKDL
ncbi:UNVERIFIED_CONTAM: hypothetical protein GTU68_039727 [Idotea baltica]|nr:hypothetical protein [Idotea baltica]